MQIQQKQARKQTEKQIAGIEREILAVYTEAMHQINLELQALYAKILSGVKPDDYYNTIIKYDRLTKNLKTIDALYIKQSIKAGGMTGDASALALSNSYYKNQFVLSWFAPNIGIDLDFTLLPPEIVEMSVYGNLSSWQEIGKKAQEKMLETFGPIKAYIPQSGTLTSFLVENRQKEVLKINRAITSGLLQGNTYTQTSKAVSEVIGKVTKEGVTGAKASAMRIVRTESNRTYNAGAYANSQAVASQGVKIEREWLATLDILTRGKHQALDGQRVGVDKPFVSDGAEAMFPGGFGIASQDIRCRCSTIDVVDGIPPSARTGRNADGEYEVFDWQNYETWAKDNGMKQDSLGKLV